MKKKICIINGSPRKQGATAKVLKRIYIQLESKPDIELSYFDLSDAEAVYCKGCESCYKTGKCCIVQDNLEAITDQLKQSDSIIIGTPTHGSNVSALLKNFIDRGHFIVEQGLYGKNCMAIATYEIADGKSALNILNKFFIVSGGTVSNKLLLKIDFNQDLSLKKVLKIDKLAKRFYEAVVENKKKSLFEYFFNDIIVVRIIWGPYFRKHPAQYRGIIEKYKSKGIHKKTITGKHPIMIE